MSVSCLSGEPNTPAVYTLIDRSVPQIDMSLLVMPLATTVIQSTEILFRLLIFRLLTFHLLTFSLADISLADISPADISLADIFRCCNGSSLMLFGFLSVRLNAQGRF